MRVAFTIIGFAGWMGGSQYQRYLLSTLRAFFPNDIEPILFVGPRDSQEEIEKLRPYVTEIITDRCFDKWTPGWIALQILTMISGKDTVTEKVFRKHKVDVVFYSGFYGTRFSVPIVNWLADLQHVKMPRMFSVKERLMRNFIFRKLAECARRIILSSEAARQDFAKLLPSYLERVDVLRFVAHIPGDIYDGEPRSELGRYNIPEKFFFLPNQFWKHKNHHLVIKALEILRERGRRILVVCTGKEEDYRNPDHFTFIKDEISKRRVEDQIILAGLVPVRHLYMFMRQSVAVLNPSFFEGWSTSVEESKSLGKPTLLSDIAVHREQDPPGAVYFDPNDAQDLAEKLWLLWTRSKGGPDAEAEKRAFETMQERAESFAGAFRNVLLKAMIRPVE